MTPDDWEVVRNWLARIEPTLPSLQARAAFGKELSALCIDMASDGELRHSCIGSMRDGLTNCSHRALFMWQQVRIAVEAHRAGRGAYDAEQLFALGRGMYRLGRVDAHALDGADVQERESVELVWRSREATCAALDLPIPYKERGNNPTMAELTGEALAGLSLQAPARSDERAGAVGESRDMAAFLMAPMSLEDAVALAAVRRNATENLVQRVLRDELRDGGRALAEFLADWAPMQAYLREANPAMATALIEVEQYAQGLIKRMDAHLAGEVPASGVPRPRLNVMEYARRMKQGGAEVEALRRAVYLAAVRGTYFACGATGDIETELQRVALVRGRDAAGPLAAGLRKAIEEGVLQAGWIHPTYRWNHAHVAAAAGDAGLIAALAGHGVPSHLPDTFGTTPLHLAAANAHPDAVRALLGLHADAEVQDKAGFRPLHCAARAGDRPTVEALLQARAQIDARRPDTGHTALHVAASEGKTELVRALIAAGANPLLRTSVGATARQLLEQACGGWFASRDYKVADEALGQAEAMARAVGRRG